MQILAALFIDTIDFRQVDGPATRIDLGGIQFSFASPDPLPVHLTPHLVVLVSCGADESGTAALVATFHDEAGAEVARNVQPIQVEPGKFGYRLVRAELTWESYGTIRAHCRLDDGPETVVPLTLLAPT
ncbi:MAG TPA: hypothetical protein VMZ22_07310 [Acidimicrobiales bacterium]|nr:hypothetical protein [Acidimicrobiales bacterium]